MVVVVGNVLSIQQPLEYFRRAVVVAATVIVIVVVVVVVVVVAAKLKSFNTSLIIFQVVRFGGRNHSPFAATCVAVEIVNVLLLLWVMVAGVVLGSDRYSNIGLGSTDGTETRTIQSDATAGNVITTESGRLSGRTAESGTVVVVVIRRSGRQCSCRIDVTV